MLDNCEHVIEAAAELADRVLASCPGVRILATSRQALGITGETVALVPPLAVPAGSAVTPEQLARCPAVRLLRDRAAAARPGFEVNQANAADVARICRELDGMPLAIELAAARLRSLSVAELPARLSEQPVRPADREKPHRGGADQTLHAVVDWSWGRLDAPERMLARRMAVFPAGLTLALAEQACAMPSAAAPGSPAKAADASVLDSVSRLVDKSFLFLDETGGAGAGVRYRMLDTIRAFCLERLAEAGEGQTAREQLCRSVLALAEQAEQAEPLLRTAEQCRWFNVLVAETTPCQSA